jgi:predicted nucleic acid-binding protein
MLMLPVRISTRTDQHSRGLEIATHLGRLKAYDSQYLAVAELERGELITIDGGMAQAAREMSLPARLLR